uniref:Uncharacterized protein n=1 Tax=Arion vulgaris TaxID=1028688 RepID=A0A0B6Y5T8_9EUPU
MIRMTMVVINEKMMIETDNPGKASLKNQHFNTHGASIGSRFFFRLMQVSASLQSSSSDDSKFVCQLKILFHDDDERQLMMFGDMMYTHKQLATKSTSYI